MRSLFNGGVASFCACRVVFKRSFRKSNVAFLLVAFAAFWPNILCSLLSIHLSGEKSLLFCNCILRW